MDDAADVTSDPVTQDARIVSNLDKILCDGDFRDDMQYPIGISDDFCDTTACLRRVSSNLLALVFLFRA